MLFFGRAKKNKAKSAPRRAPARPARTTEKLAPEVPDISPEVQENLIAQVQEPKVEQNPEAGEKKRRRARPGKTKLIGFDTSDGRVVDLFDEEGAETAQSGRCSFPVGWMIVVSGPGRGECFALQSGMSQIGRGEDQAVCLDFGDMAISRTNHAAIVYDPGNHTFLLGHGGKANIVRLNGTPVVSTSDLGDGDIIEIGETKLQFKALCSGNFNWAMAEAEDEGDDDVEIA